MRAVLRLVWLGITLLFVSGCRESSRGPVRLAYWEKWSGFEASAMQKVVDQFNRTVGAEKGIVVEYLSVANVDRKTIVATAGGDPPDLAGVWLANIYSWADRDALLPLDDFIRADGETPEHWLTRYYPVYASMCSHKGKIWGALTTPSTTALHWNKALFRAAGLDPDRPPTTLAEMDALAEKLTVRDPQTGRLTQLGFLPQEPGWFAWAFPQWFGGQLWDGTNITFTTVPENLAAFRWVAGYTDRLGLDAIKSFTSGFGNFASPQNAFIAGKVAMIFQGVWMDNYIRQYSPNFEYGVAPWPTAHPGLENFTVADADMVAIPRGTKHPREAWEFIRFVSSINRQAQSVDELTGMELLCYGQKKNSPLREWSPAFEKFHPHPHIGLFRQLAQSPHAVHAPKIGIWQEYGRETGLVFEKARLQEGSVEDAMAFCQDRVTQSWATHRASLKRRGAAE